jgi:hypothetical protein
MTTAEFFEYLASRDSSRRLAGDLLAIWIGVPAFPVEGARVRVPAQQVG